MKYKNKIKICTERIKDMDITYEEFIEYLMIGQEARIKIDNCIISFWNNGEYAPGTRFPIQELIIQEDENYNHLNKYHIYKNELETFKPHNNMTLKELFEMNNFDYIELF